jgi:DNA-binding HxlR family transcriptional regulator
MKTIETIRLLKALADRSRLQIVSCLLEKPQYVEELSERLGLAPSTVSFHLRKLEDADLVTSIKEQYYTTYHMKDAVLGHTLRELVTIDDPAREDQEERLQLYCQKVIRNFIRYGKLTRIPAQLKKRKIILEEIAKRFKPGRIYPEREVNLIIADFHDDFCTLRRELITHGIMKRDHGKYWLVGKD